MHLETIHSHHSGARISTPKFRENLKLPHNQNGLDQDYDRFHLLRLAKQVGKDGGFTPELIELLEYYVVRTQTQDWEEGESPICYQSVTTTAHALQISERQVRNRENSLNKLGAISWNDSGNFKRFGVRDRNSGKLQYAFGVDLSPLASLAPSLELKLREREAHRIAWDTTKRAISALRANIRSLLAEMEQYPQLDEHLQTVLAEYGAIAYSIRSYHTLPKLKHCLNSIKLYLTA